jgi:hypothetical protein
MVYLTTEFQILECRAISPREFLITANARIYKERVVFDSIQDLDNIEFDALIQLQYKFRFSEKLIANEFYDLDNAINIDVQEIVIDNKNNEKRIRRYLEDYFEQDQYYSCEPKIKFYLD